MLAKDMCSKNPEVGTLFAQFITKVFLIQRIFRVLRNSLFQNKRPFAKFAFSEQTTFTQKTKRSKIFARKELAPFCLQGYYLKKG